MSRLVFDSGPLDGLTPETPVVVAHAYGKIPSVYAVYRFVDGQDCGWEIDPSLPPAQAAGVFVSAFNENEATISMREGFTFEGKAKLVMFD